MVTSITSGLQSALIGLARTTKQENNQSDKLSSGKNITSAKDDPVRLKQLTELTSTIEGLEQANRNIDYADSIANVATGGLEATLSNLQSLRSVAVQAADDTLSASEREALSTQASSLTAAINDTSGLEINGTALLDGSFSTTVQVGAHAGDTLNMSLGDTSTSGLSIDSLDLSTSSGAGSAITTIDSAISAVTSQMASLGSTQNALEGAYTTNQSNSTNLAQAKSGIEDLDYAAAVGQMVQLNLQKQTQATLMSSLADTKGQIVSLLA